MLHRLVLLSVCLIYPCPGETAQTGTGKVDPAQKFKCTTAAREWVLSTVFLIEFFPRICSKLYTFPIVLTAALSTAKKAFKLYTCPSHLAARFLAPYMESVEVHLNIFLKRHREKGGGGSSHTRSASYPQFTHKHRLAAKRSPVARPWPQPNCFLQYVLIFSA